MIAQFELKGRKRYFNNFAGDLYRTMERLPSPTGSSNIKQ